MLFLNVLLAAAAWAQTGKLGVFTNAEDVGNPAIKGATAFDATKGEYRITGAGANMWAKADQFQFAWRTMTGDLTVTATMEFLGQGNEHRKAGIVLRQTLDTDSPYVDFVIHGNGMPAVQWRNTKGDITNAADFPFTGPGKFRLKLVRQGNTITVFLAKDSTEVKEILHTQVALGNPVLVGLGVCSHDEKNSDVVVFTDVSVESNVRATRQQ
jgi:hypothetical protein